MTACATNAARVTGLPITWTEVRPFGVPDNPNDDNIFWHVAYGGGKFLAVKNNVKVLLYSEDGVTWTEVTPYPFNWDWGRGTIGYGNGTFVAGRGNNKFISADGITWTKLEDTELEPRSFTYGDGKFFSGSGWKRIYYSTDGVTWTYTEIPFVVCRAIAYGNGKFVAVGHEQEWGGNWAYMTPGQIAYSADGITWTGVEQNIFAEDMIIDIAYGNGKFVAVSEKVKMAYSSDGVAWTEIEQNIFGEEDPIRAIAYGGGKFVVVGAWSGKAAYSTDGITWTQAQNVPTSNRGIFDIAYGNGRFVIVLGEDKIAYSNLQE